jgi:Holliday junction resolvasome RuvABC endonuclease subunit
MPTLVAFDYSLSCPCMCVSTESGWKNAFFFYLTTVKKATGVFCDGRVVGDLHKDYRTEQERYNNIADHFMSILDTHRINKYVITFIEDYSFGSKGKVFHIAENCGILKHKLWSRGSDIETIPPTVIKKFATTKGNADKQGMYDAFIKQTEVDLQSMSPDKKLGSPVTDIVDAYFIAQMGHELIKEMGV